MWTFKAEILKNNYYPEIIAETKSFILKNNEINLLNILRFDTIGGQPATWDNVTLTQISSTHVYLFICVEKNFINYKFGDIIMGYFFIIDNSLPGGNYTLVYRITDKKDPSNYKDVAVYVYVTQISCYINAFTVKRINSVTYYKTPYDKTTLVLPYHSECTCFNHYGIVSEKNVKICIPRPTYPAEVSRYKSIYYKVDDSNPASYVTYYTDKYRSQTATKDFYSHKEVYGTIVNPFGSDGIWYYYYYYNENCTEINHYGIKKAENVELC